MSKTNDFVKGKTVVGVTYVHDGVLVTFTDNTSIVFSGEIVNKEFGLGSEVKIVPRFIE
jgi:hypothetical protein